MFLRRALLAALVLAVALPCTAPAKRSKRSAAPKDLKAFLLTYNEPARRNFPRTPSFSWKPVRGAINYEFQLATAENFRDNSILWSSETLRMPTVSVPLSLPWATGRPYSLFARVRAETQSGTTRWTNDYGFNVRWPEIPTRLPAPNGLLRWTPVEGAVAYEVLEITTPDEINTDGFAKKVHTVTTNVTDTRDWFTFHTDPYLSNLDWWAANIYWRVRAVRVTYSTTGVAAGQNSHPVTSYGPWSPLYHNPTTPPGTSPITLTGTTSDVIGSPASSAAHTSMPGLTWMGGRIFDDLTFDLQLYRAYVFSDRECTQPVYTGSIVGSPAWVPRYTGALGLPGSFEDAGKALGAFLSDGNQGGGFDNALHPVSPNENEPDSGGGETTSNAIQMFDLWDRKWPDSPYYWTVVPVRALVLDDVVTYYDQEMPQDVCAAGRVGMFGRVSKPVPMVGAKAYVIGMSATGRMKSLTVSGSPRVYGSPLVTWTPVQGAHSYELQVSKKRNPFRAEAKLVTPATSALLSSLAGVKVPGAFPLTPGGWYYRVRGIDTNLPVSAQGMVWSSVRKVRIAKPTFRVGKK